MANPPTISYFTKRNGATIAYAVTGAATGIPIVFVPAWVQSIDAPLLLGGSSAAIAEGFRLIQYDKQGTGLSDRTLDIEAGFGRHADEVVELLDHLDVEQAALIGGSQSGPVVLDAAARNRERVSRVVVIAGYAKGPGLFKPAATGAMVELVKNHWGYGSKILTDMFRMTPTAEEADAYSEWMRRCADSEVAGALLQEVYDADVSARLEDISAPTLVLHRRGDRAIPYRGGQEIAAKVPNASFMPLDGPVHGLGDEPDTPAAVTRIREFLGASPADVRPADYPFQTILFTDLESSTALTQRVGDEAAQEVVRGHNSTVRAALAVHGGSEVKHTGDGIMAAFPSAVRAVEAALQIQRDLVGGEVRVRIGINAGEPIAEDDDFFGTAVQLARRICDRAEPGQVLVSRVVADLCAGKKLQFSHHSDATLKGFAEPVALYEVGSP